MSGMVAWLAVELVRAEELARLATPGPWRLDVDDEEIHAEAGTVARMRDFVRRMSSVQVEADMQLIVGMADPTAVLRRMAADRQILAEHGPGGMGDDRDETECRTCSGPTPGFSGSWPVEWPCRTVRLLAEAYGWTEDGS